MDDKRARQREYHEYLDSQVNERRARDAAGTPDPALAAPNASPGAVRRRDRRRNKAQRSMTPPTPQDQQRGSPLRSPRLPQLSQQNNPAADELAQRLYEAEAARRRDDTAAAAVRARLSDMETEVNRLRAAVKTDPAQGVAAAAARADEVSARVAATVAPTPHPPLKKTHRRPTAWPGPGRRWRT